MADPTLSQKMVVMLGDGEVSETFAWPCGATARSVKIKNNVGEDIVLDCTNPTTTKAAINRWLESQEAELSISGRVAIESFATWQAWATGGTEMNVRAVLDEALADNGGYWGFAGFLTEFEMGQEGTATATFSATIMSSGRLTWTDAAS